MVTGRLKGIVLDSNRRGVTLSDLLVRIEAELAALKSAVENID